MRRYRESQQHVYFLMRHKIPAERLAVISFKGESTDQRELVLEAWDWFEKIYGYYYNHMINGRLAILLSHEHPFKYWRSEWDDPEHPKYQYDAKRPFDQNTDQTQAVELYRR